MVVAIILCALSLQLVVFHWDFVVFAKRVSHELIRIADALGRIAGDRED